MGEPAGKKDELPHSRAIHRNNHDTKDGGPHGTGDGILQHKPPTQTQLIQRHKQTAVITQRHSLTLRWV